MVLIQPKGTSIELAVELAVHLLDHAADPTDRMILRDQILGAQRREHRRTLLEAGGLDGGEFGHSRAERRFEEVAGLITDG